MNSFLPDVNEKPGGTQRAFERKTSQGKRVGVNYTCYRKRIPNSQSIQFRFGPGPKSNQVSESQKAISTNQTSNMDAYQDHDFASNKTSLPIESVFKGLEPQASASKGTKQVHQV